MDHFVVHGIPGSPYVRAVLLTLEEKAAPFTLARMAMGEHRESAHLARNPFGRIPVLDHGDFRLYETQAILRYIDAVVTNPPLRPADPVAAARVDQLMNIADWYVFQQVLAKIGFQRTIVPMRGGVPDEAIIAAALPDAHRCVDVLSGFLSDHLFIAGNALTLADLMLAPMLASFHATPEGAALLGGTLLAGYLARMDARESMRRTTRERLLQAA